MKKSIYLLFIFLLFSCEDEAQEDFSIISEDFEDNSFTADGWGVEEHGISFEPWQISSEKSRSGTRSMASAVLTSDENLSMLYIYRVPTGMYGSYKTSFYINLECHDVEADANLTTLVQSSNTTPTGQQSIQSRSTSHHQQVGPTSEWEKVEFEFSVNGIATPPNILWIFQGKSGEANLGSDCRCFIDDFKLESNW